MFWAGFGIGAVATVVLSAAAVVIWATRPGGWWQ